MGKALIIGAGGVAGVVIHKCCQNSEVFTEICIASRTKSKCDKFKEELQDKTATKITTAQVDANDVDQLIALIEQEKPDIVINVALPYQDLTIWTLALQPRRTMWTPQTMNRKIRQSLSTSGSGLIGNASKKLASQLCWAAALTPA